MAEEVHRAVATEKRRLKALEDEKAEEAGRGAQPRQGNAAGIRAAQTLRPARQRQLVEAAQVDWGVSQRHRIKGNLRDRVRYGYRRVHVHPRGLGCEPQESPSGLQ
jgi:hypothetical protein